MLLSPFSASLRPISKFLTMGDQDPPFGGQSPQSETLLFGTVLFFVRFDFRVLSLNRRAIGVASFL